MLIFIGKTLHLELTEESQVVFEEEAYVLDAILEDRNPVDAHPPGKTGVAAVVDPGHPQHLRVNHPCPEDFDPACLLADATALAEAENAADVDFRARLHERKVPGAEPHLSIGMED